MAKLTRRQTQNLERILYHLQRADNYLSQPTLVVTKRCQAATTTLHFTRSDGQVLYEVNKEYGSDLTGLKQGIHDLEKFLFPVIESEESS